MTTYLIYGEEDYLIHQAVGEVRKRHVNPDMVALSHKVLVKPDVGEAIEAVSAVTFNLGGETLIEIRNFDLLSRTPDSDTEEKQLEELKALLPDLDPAKHVLFVNDKINRRYKFPKWLTSDKALAAQVSECKPLNFWEADKAVEFLMREAGRLDIKLQPQAAALLVEHMGVGLQPLLNEIQKLAVFTGGAPVTPDAVRILSNHNENTFAMLGDWIKDRNRTEVYRTLEEILLRDHPIRLFALIQSHLNHIFQLRLWQGLGMSFDEMAKRNKKHPFKIRKDYEEYRQVPMTRLETLRQKTLEYEWQSKTGGLDSRLAVEMLLGA